MRRSCAVGVCLASVCLMLAVASAHAVDVGYYFEMSNELSDLPYPGTEFYGEVGLSLLSLNNLSVEVNAFASPGEYDFVGNYISSPLVAGPNFGIQQFGINSTLIADEADFDAFCSYYDVTVPSNWGFNWGGVAGELGKFEFWYGGTGNSRQDPLVILITPKSGAVIPTGFEIDSVFDFVELCPQGNYFSMHVAGFSTDPSYWEEGCSDVSSAFFAVDADTYIIPEPATLLILSLGLATLLLRARRR